MPHWRRRCPSPTAPGTGPDVATVALLVHAARPEARQLALEAADWLGSAGHRTRLLELGRGGRVDEDGETGFLRSVDLEGTDLAVSLGGDGTFLRLVPVAWAADVPILGVNFGKVGYLLSEQPGDLVATLDRALAGTTELDLRAAIEVSTADGHAPSSSDDGSEDGRPTGPWVALNEVVLEKTVFGHTVRLGTAIDGEPFLSYAADGLLVATATGSTAYNLSAGGPVLAPSLRGMVVTPVAPHLTLDRSVVVGPEHVVTVEILPERPAALVVDGLEAGRLAPGRVVSARVADRPVRLVTTRPPSFGGLLRRTLARRHGD